MDDQPVAVDPADPAARSSSLSLLRRSARRTNAGLLVLLIGAFASGWVAFAGGAPTTASLTTAVHGLFGMAVIALLPWKTVIIRRSARLRIASLVLLVIMLGCLLAGFVELFAGYVVVLGVVTPIQVHVGAAAVCVPLVAWHVLRHRRQLPRRSDLSRRVLLQNAVLASGVAAAYGVVATTALLTRPERPRAATGSRPVAEVAEVISVDAIPATIWLFDRSPPLDPTAHRVVVAGTPVSMAELSTRAENVSARLDCTNGWYADAVWAGVRLADLIPADLLAAAASVRVRSVTGYERSFSAADAGDLWLAISCQGRPLRPGHGAPVRLVAPGHRGFWWVKWVASVDVSDQPDWLQPPFPLQ